MRYRKGMLAGAMLALLPLLASTAANAQKQGGTLRIFHRDSPQAQDRAIDDFMLIGEARAQRGVPTTHG